MTRESKAEEPMADNEAVSGEWSDVDLVVSPCMSRLSNSPHLERFTSSPTAFAVTLRDAIDSFVRDHYIFVAFQLVILSSLFFWYLQLAFPTPTPAQLQQQDPRMDALKTKAADLAVKAADATVSAPAGDVKELDPPKDTPFTKEELAKNDGRDENTPIYVAIKGRIYDVSAKRDMYGPGCGYHVFVGKDASRGLGKSSLKPEDAVSDYSTLTAEEKQVLDDWEKYFQKRYNIVGRVVE
ncbi:hypothetical protein C6P46_006079 [Rhodotorula mucilaginosa]|uniref:Cytochrome b5 heme-binding domain-containing protein n=1 Tax=Rhodotorula mucilaginosa TaxID=5537 RepID=A0A9P6VZ94_RHOMI|nr:hypothetical protein C6P46_006079 [Rhodotorula mucilaginosa]